MPGLRCGERGRYRLIAIAYLSLGLVIGRPQRADPSSNRFENVADGTKRVVSPLSLETLFAELRRESKEMAEVHLGSMLLVASYGDHFYNLEEKTSDECQRTLAAAVGTSTNLRTFERMDEVMNAVMADGYEDVMYATRLRHPLEFLCDRIEQRLLYASTVDSQLYAEFERVKRAAKNRALPDRKPYLLKISESEKELGAFYLYMMKIPQMARYLAHKGFQDQLYASEAYNRSFHALAKAVLIVAGREELATSVQRVYDKTLDEVADFIGRTRFEKLRLLEDGKTYWFSETVMSKLKKYFDESTTLKTELEKTIVELADEKIGATTRRLGRNGPVVDTRALAPSR